MYNAYVQAILADRIPSSTWVKKACKRHINDLKTANQRGLYFDQTSFDRVLKFISMLKHTTGEWTGNNFVPEPWEQFILSQIFGWKKSDGTRRYRTSYLTVARKNGKTCLAAAIGLYLFFADLEGRAEVYSVATKYDQARLSHQEAVRMVKTCTDLSNYVDIFKNNLSVTKTFSKFEPLGGDSKTQDGLNIHGAILDELHAWPNRDLYDVIVTATGARRQPLIFTITTAGFDKHSICWEQQAYTEKVLDGIIDDDSNFGIIYGLDDGDNWEDKKNWIKSNPNLGITVKVDDLENKARKAKEVPAQLNSFLRLHMNVWTESEVKWISSDAWNACGSEVDPVILRGKLCFAGLDLSSTTDISAFVLVFPPEHDNDTYKIMSRFWIPSDNIERRVRRDRVPYDVWVKQGFIEATPGPVIDYGYILRQIEKDSKAYMLKEICFDRWGATKIVQDLEALGYGREEPGKRNKYQSTQLIDFGQGFVSMNSPTKELEKLLLSKAISHSNNPVLAWMASNVVIRLDPAGNMKPDKSKSTEKIDGIVALIMAIDRATRAHDAVNPYAERGILVI